MDVTMSTNAYFFKTTTGEIYHLDHEDKEKLKFEQSEL